MFDPMAGLIAAGAAKSAPASVAVVGEVIDPAAELSAPKRALIGAAEELFGMVTGSLGRLPWGMRAAVEVMLRQVQGGLLVSAISSMEEEEVRRLITEVRDRAAAALQ